MLPMSSSRLKNSLFAAAVISAVTALSAAALIITYSSIGNNINHYLSLKLGSLHHDIESRLDSHSSLVKSLALLGHMNAGNISPIEHVIILKNFCSYSPENRGFGIWYEPYMYKGVKYYGSFVNMDNGIPVFSAEYSSASYDHLSREWYIACKKSASTGSVTWSAPISENTDGTTVLSAASPFFDSSNRLLGIAAGDLDISGIIKEVESFRDENTGLRAILLNEAGIIKTSSGKMMPDGTATNCSVTADFKIIGKAVSESDNGIACFDLSGGPAIMHFRRINSTGWTLCFMADAAPFYTTFRRMLMLMISLILIVIIATVVCHRAVSVRAKTPLNQINDFALKISNGDLSGRIPGENNDQMGMLVKTFNRSADSLEKRISEIKDAAEKIDRTIERISALKKAAPSDSDNPESVIARIDTAIGEYIASVELNAANMRRARELTDEGVNKSSAGSSEASGVIESINEINESSSRIGDITALINEIAFQTNLLALNAAIEAARAGNQGRGFAVVASEVRNLAQRSAGAAKEIGKLINESAARVERGTRLVLKSGEYMKEISSAAGTTAALFAEMARSGDEQLAGLEKIRIAVAELDSVIKRRTDFYAGNGSEMNELAEQVKEMIELFNSFNFSKGPGRD